MPPKLKKKALLLIVVLVSFGSLFSLTGTARAKTDYSAMSCDQLITERDKVCQKDPSSIMEINSSFGAGNPVECAAVQKAFAEKKCVGNETEGEKSGFLDKFKDKVNKATDAAKNKVKQADDLAKKAGEKAKDLTKSKDGDDAEGAGDGTCDEFRGSQNRMCEASGAGMFLTDTLKNLLGPGPMLFLGMGESGEWLKPYAVSFGLGAIILAITLMMGIAQSADGKKVSGWELLAGVGLRAYIYFPAMLMAPALVAALSGLSNDMAESLMGQAGNATLENIKKLYEAFANPLTVIKMAASGLGSVLPVIGMVLCLIILVIALLALVIELAVVQFSTYLLTIIMPMALALAISPKMRQFGTKIISALIAVLLIKPAIWFALWIGNTVLSGTLDQTPEGILGTYSLQQLATMALMLAVLLMTTAAVPVLAPSVLKWVIGSGGEGWQRPQMPWAGRYAAQRGIESGYQSASRSLRSRGGSGRGTSSTTKAPGKRSMAGSKEALGGGSSAAAGAGGAAGIFGVILAIGKKGLDKFRNAVGRSRNSVDDVAEGAGGQNQDTTIHPDARNPRPPQQNGGPNGSNDRREFTPREPFEQGSQEQGPRQPREPKGEPPKGSGL